MSSAQQSPPICTHERRPGTTVCVHCRHEAHVAARDRRRRLLLRGTALGIVLATFLAAGVMSASALRGRFGIDLLRNQSRHSAPPVQTVASAPTSQPDSVSQQGAAPTSAPVTDPAAANAQVANPDPASAQVTNAVASTIHPSGPLPPFGPVIDVGETPVAPGIIAVRTDSAVSVFFDTPYLRTRIPEKFEALVRETLPKIFGRGADSALAKLKTGEIAAQGDLLTDLPIRGIRIPIDTTWAITLYPSTRDGRDGPLVVRYRAAVMAR